MDGTARVVQQIEEFVKSRKWCRNTYKAISTSNQQATQHAYLLVKWVRPLSKYTDVQVRLLTDVANKCESVMTKLNKEFSLDCKTNELEFDVDSEILNLKHLAVQQVIGILCKRAL